MTSKVKRLSFLILITLIFTLGKANAAEIGISYAGIWSNYVYFADIKNDDFCMALWAFVKADDGSNPVYLKDVNETFIDPPLNVPRLPGWDEIFRPYFQYGTIGLKYGYDEINKNYDKWEGKEYQFYIEDGTGGNIATKNIYISPSMDIKKLDVVENIKIYGYAHPKVEWEWNNPERVNFFRVRIFTVEDKSEYSKNLKFNSENIYYNGRTTYSYTYDGGLFVLYKELAIVVEAYQQVGATLEVVNRSRYYFIHNADSDNDGVIDDWDLCLGTPEGSLVTSDGCANECYTPAEVDQIVYETVEQACPGNSEYHGRPFLPTN